MMMGAALKSNELTWGWLRLGQLGLADRRFDLGECLLQVGPEIELREHQRDGVARARLHRLEAGHVLDGALDGLGHLGRDVLGPSTRQGRDDGDERQLDIGDELLSELVPREDPGQEDADRKQDDDALLSESELGQTDHAGVLSGLDLRGLSLVEALDFATEGDEAGAERHELIVVKALEQAQGHLGA